MATDNAVNKKQAARRMLGNQTLIREEIHTVWTSIRLEQLIQDALYGVLGIICFRMVRRIAMAGPDAATPGAPPDAASSRAKG